ncbi:EamA family transporter [Flavobacteriaceae bacterium LMO-SS05]
MAIPRSKGLIILAFFAIYVIWGSTYLLNKIVVTEVAPLLLASIRFLTAGAIIVIIAYFMKLQLKVSSKQLVNCIIAGFLFLGFGNGLFVWALKYVDSGFAALEAATQPLFVILLMRMIHGHKIKSRSLFGIVLGILGMYLLISQEGLTVNEDSTLGIVMILICVISWSYASIFVSKADLPSSFFVSTAYQMLAAGFILFAASFFINEPWLAPTNWSVSAQWAMILLIVFGSIVAFTAFNYLLKVVSTEKVSTSAFVNPVIALLLGWYILDEHISFQSIIAASILLTGVYFINSKKKFVTFSRFSKK